MVKIYIKTFGCALNQSDSELMQGLLVKEGYGFTQNEKESDLVIINSCTVKNEAENKLYKEIRKHKGKKILIAGCVPQAQQDLSQTKLKDYSIIGTSQLQKICMAVEETLLGNRVVMLDDEPNVKLNLPKIRKNDIIEIIPISEGCLGKCSYCKTKQARGNLYSYGKDQIILHTAMAIKNGAKEIWITSQDTGAYGLDIGSSLPELLKGVLDIEGDFKVRLGMCNPNFAHKYLDELIELLQHPKMYRFIHVPVQSGSDNILRMMNRQYKKDDFVNVVTVLRKLVKDITIATDIIVGFPTESDSDFEESIAIVKSLRPDIVNVSRFWKRPGTPAEKLKPLDTKTVKQRSKKLMDVFKEVAIENNRKWIGWRGKALVEEKSKNKTFTARNFAYKPIIIKYSSAYKIGDEIDVAIKGASQWDLRA